MGRGRSSPRLCVTVLWLSTCALLCCASPLQYMGFYGYSPDDMVGWTNAAASDNATVIQQGWAQGTTTLFEVESIFFQFNAPTAPHPGCQLRSDYAARWQAAVPTIQELVTSGAVIGFMMGDELVWNGLEVASLETAAQLVKQTFPKLIVWENEATAPLKSGVDYYGHHHNFSRVPSSLDYLSVDMYHMDGPSPGFVSTVRSFYETYIYPKLGSHQRAWLVPGSFESAFNPACNASCYDAMCALDAANFYKWAAEDAMVTGIVPWHWYYCDGCAKFKDEIGTLNMTKTRAKWREIGQLIVGKSQPRAEQRLEYY